MINRVYSSVEVDTPAQVGLVGHAGKNAKNVTIQMSVHSSQSIVGQNESVFNEDRNFNSLHDILGKVYCAKGVCWDNETVWSAVPDSFPKLQIQISPSPSAFPTPSGKPSVSGSQPHESATLPTRSETQKSNQVQGQISRSPPTSPSPSIAPSSPPAHSQEQKLKHVQRLVLPIQCVKWLVV